LNLNQIRVFEAVYRTGSMTIASEELHLTQSGVSQHIKALENTLEVNLFDRFNQRLVPTQAAKTLFEKCTLGLQSIESALWEITGKQTELRGTIGLGMPIEFGNNVILPLIAKFGKLHPDVKFEISLGFASEMDEKLLSGSIDFAFIDDVNMSTPIKVEEVYKETLELCVHPDLIKDLGKRKVTKSDFAKINFIAYQKGEPLLHRWFQMHFPGKQFDLNVRATIMDVQATARLITEGFGAGVLPGYIVDKMIAAGDSIVALKGEGKPVINKIKLAQLGGRTLSPSAMAAIDFIRSHL
jgi:DNA-binding transcriptional LysR family regulator